MAEALVVALTLVAVVAFVRSTGAPSHAPAQLSHTTGPSVTTPTAPSTTAVPVASPPSVDSQLAAWWSGTGQPETTALLADLDAVGQSGVDVADPSATCGALSSDTAAVAAAPPAPLAAIEREWQLTVSTSTRAALACEAGRTTALAGDLQPAMYTIRDLSAQIKPYLAS